MTIDEQLDRLSKLIWDLMYHMTFSNLISVIGLIIITISMIDKLFTGYLDQYILNIGVMIFVLKLCIVQNLFLRSSLRIDYYSMYLIFIEVFSMIFMIGYPNILFGLVILNNLLCLGTYIYISIYNSEYDNNMISRYIKAVYDTNLYSFIGLMIILSHTSYTSYIYQHPVIKVE